MSENIKDFDIQSVVSAAEAGGKVVRSYFGTALEIHEKTTAADIRTLADTESENVIVDFLSQNFPNYNIHAEEQGLIDRQSEYTFVIDPLDGSNNFVLGIPNFAVSIGLVRGDETIAGVVHLPMIADTYSAIRGNGAFLNGERISVNKEADYERAAVSFVAAYDNHREYFGWIARKKTRVKRHLFNWASAVDYCLLASGRIEAVVVNGSEWYDYVAGKLIAREAGALITDMRGQPEKHERNNRFLASNGTAIHERLVSFYPHDELVQSGGL